MPPYAEAAEALLRETAEDSFGDFSPSVYETARVMRYAPSLAGQSRRLQFLLEQQRAGGEWGESPEYALLPTLSAIEALLFVLLRAQIGPETAAMTDSVNRGFKTLFGWLNTGPTPDLPDTVAVELAVPGLIRAINDRLAAGPAAGLDAWRGRRLADHPGDRRALLDILRGELLLGTAPPPKLLHSLEIFGAAAHAAPGVRPSAGAVGCSPAATAVWLGDAAVRAGRHPGVRYLHRAGRDGGVPVAGPLATFERAWVLVALATAGLVPPVADALVDNLEAAFGEHGVAAGPGLPPDADDTAAALHALALLGRPRSPACLLGYRDGDHFACFPPERTPSTSTNAHVLQAFGASAPARHRGERAVLTAWLCGQQDPAGYWRDKWHASPYYATACCVAALAGHGEPLPEAALRRAARWVFATQRTDGSWGRWRGTYEETAYAVRILATVPVPEAGPALAAGSSALRRLAGGPHPPLWHDKDLYTPVRIVRAEGLAALHLAEVRRRGDRPGRVAGEARPGGAR